MAKRFPSAEVVAIEPSLTNFQMLTLNTAGYSNVRRLNVEVWGHSSRLGVVGNVGGDWGVRLTESNDGDAGVPGLSIPDILAHVSWNDIDYLKCDIEGAELGVFAESGAMNAGTGQCFRTITLTNVRTEGWVYYMFDTDSCQLHPAPRNQPPAELYTSVQLIGNTALESDLSVLNPIGFAVDFIIKVRNDDTDEEILNTRITTSAGVAQHWRAPLPGPAYGTHRVTLQTVMSADSPTNHQAIANWISPCFSA